MDSDIQSPNSSINYTLAPGDKLIQCPYVPAHQILEEKFVTHLNKCRNNYRKMMKTKGNDYVKMATCRWNFCHQLPEIELQLHEENCPDAHQYLQELQQLKKNNLSHQSGGVARGRSHADGVNKNSGGSYYPKAQANQFKSNGKETKSTARTWDYGPQENEENVDDEGDESSRERKNSWSTIDQYTEDWGWGWGDQGKTDNNDNDTVKSEEKRKEEEFKNLYAPNPRRFEEKKVGKVEIPVIKPIVSPWTKYKPDISPSSATPSGTGAVGNGNIVEAGASTSNGNGLLDTQFPTLESVLQPSPVKPVAAALRSVLRKYDYQQLPSASEDNWGNSNSYDWAESSDEDDWEMYTNHAQAPSYDPKIKLQQENVLFMPRGLTKSERKAYREKSRLKLINTTERLTLNVGEDSDKKGHIPVGADGWK